MSCEWIKCSFMRCRDVQCYGENLSLMAENRSDRRNLWRKLLFRDGDKNLLSPPRHLWGAKIFGTADLYYRVTQSSPPVTPAGFVPRHGLASSPRSSST